MRWLLSNDTAMTWLLCGSVFFMFFALGWRDTGKGKRSPRMKAAGREAPWTVSRLLVTGIVGVFAGVVAFPPAICAALVRAAIFYRKRKAAEAGPRRSAVKRS
jgi:hypothetical protein